MGFSATTGSIAQKDCKEPPENRKKAQPIKPTLPKPPKFETFNANYQEQKRRPCVYCDSPAHQLINCDKVVTIQERKKHLIHIWIITRNRQGRRPVRKEQRRIEMMIQAATKEIEIYEVFVK